MVTVHVCSTICTLLMYSTSVWSVQLICIAHVCGMWYIQLPYLPHSSHLPSAVDPESSKYFTKMLALGKEVKDELVDPYVVVSFAGHKEVTKAISHTSNPEWKAEVNLEVRVCCAILYLDCTTTHAVQT